MKNQGKLGIEVPEILIPDEKVNMRKWSVVACDQFTTNQRYWNEVERMVGNSPSTLHIMLPEIYLDVYKRQDKCRWTSACNNGRASYERSFRFGI